MSDWLSDLRRSNVAASRLSPAKFKPVIMVLPDGMASLRRFILGSGKIYRPTFTPIAGRSYHVHVEVDNQEDALELEREGWTKKQETS